MVIDFNNLSSDELFELAKRKRQDEEREKARLASIDGLRERRKQVAEEHSRALQAIDVQIRELHQKRGKLAMRYKQEVDAIDGEIESLNREIRAASPSPPGGATPPKAPQPAPTQSTPAKPEPEVSVDDAIIAILRERRDISEGLLKERLQAQGIKVASLSKALQRLVKAGRLISRGSDNYALKKR